MFAITTTPVPFGSNTKLALLNVVMLPLAIVRPVSETDITFATPLAPNTIGPLAAGIVTLLVPLANSLDEAAVTPVN